LLGSVLEVGRIACASLLAKTLLEAHGRLPIEPIA
jgi:hypothetical protein